MLKIQYRFNDKLNRFPSKMLYDQELIPDETVRDRKLGDLLLQQQEEDRGGDDDLEDLNEEIVFFDSESISLSLMSFV
jgi:superfamily I DNA and/or RNA helicase